ncbi:hypothetical protein SAMN02745887_02362 [Chitinimonas taiwanensis DSM 18899]|uniref:Uncharacterized protein n=1 Tax=Chitinimonas taiwanensis DSM 18899 TaxID=1121279 RepID=A0A1K2HKQ6_9NEIS|nr:hypothetical protein SAMN02745887_02362 [Chitinimonas taiwanensis DSM 18899]
MKGPSRLTVAGLLMEGLRHCHAQQRRLACTGRAQTATFESSTCPLALTHALLQLSARCQATGPIDISNRTPVHFNNEMLNIQHRVQRRINVWHGQADCTGLNIRHREIQRIHRLCWIFRLFKRHCYRLRGRWPRNIRAPKDQHTTLIGFSGADNTDRAILFSPSSNAVISGCRVFLRLKNLPFTLHIAQVSRIRFQLLYLFSQVLLLFCFVFQHLLLDF